MVIWKPTKHITIADELKFTSKGTPNISLTRSDNLEKIFEKQVSKKKLRCLNLGLTPAAGCDIG